MSEPGSGSIDAIVITGPTGAGKTALALEIGARLPVEIISVDSAMVYRGLDIGSGKPTLSERRTVPHHLIDIRDPSETYSAGQFVSDCRRLLGEIHRGGRLPLIVGGTMLYLRALARGIAPLPEADPVVRAALDERARQVGWQRLHAELARVDPAAACRITPRDAQRIQRALEVYELTGEPLSKLQARAAASTPPLVLRQFAWGPADRSVLYQRIEDRFAVMLESGLLGEVERLHARTELSPTLPALRCVGYRQLWAYCEGRVRLEEASAAAVRATRHLARRQLTWLRSEPALAWLDSLEAGSSAQIFGEVERGVERRLSA